MFALRSKTLRIVAPAVGILALAGGAFAFTAANTGTQAGNGGGGSSAAVVSGYAVAGLNYNMAADGVTLKSASFTLTPSTAAASNQASYATVLLNSTTSQGTWLPNAPTADGTSVFGCKVALTQAVSPWLSTVTCYPDTAADGQTFANVNTLDIIATSGATVTPTNP